MDNHSNQDSDREDSVHSGGLSRKYDDESFEEGAVSWVRGVQNSFGIEEIKDTAEEGNAGDEFLLKTSKFNSNSGGLKLSTHDLVEKKIHQMTVAQQANVEPWSPALESNENDFSSPLNDSIQSNLRENSFCYFGSNNSIQGNGSAEKESIRREDIGQQRALQPWSVTNPPIEVEPSRTFSRQTSQSNFDQRNVATFGAAAVQAHQYGQNTAEQSTPKSWSRSQYNRQYSNTSSEIDNLRMKMPEIRDRRTQELILDISREGEADRNTPQRRFDRMAQYDEYASMESSWAKQVKQQQKALEFKIEILEDVFDEIIDPDSRHDDNERSMKLLELLARTVSSSSVLDFSKNTHARRLLLFSLSILMRDRNFHSHVLSVFNEMLANLDKLLMDDRTDMVYAHKTSVFRKIIDNCSMDQVLIAMYNLLKASRMAIGSKMGLFFLGRFLERAHALDYEKCPYWASDVIPVVKKYLSHVDMKFVNEFVGKTAIMHIETISEHARTRETFAPYRSDTASF